MPDSLLLDLNMPGYNGMEAQLTGLQRVLTRRLAGFNGTHVSWKLPVQREKSSD